MSAAFEQPRSEPVPDVQQPEILAAVHIPERGGRNPARRPWRLFERVGTQPGCIVGERSAVVPCGVVAADLVADHRVVLGCATTLSRELRHGGKKRRMYGGCRWYELRHAVCLVASRRDSRAVRASRHTRLRVPPAWRNWQRTALVKRWLGVRVPSPAPTSVAPTSACRKSAPCAMALSPNRV